jgi:hypothetical protein
MGNEFPYKDIFSIYTFQRYKAANGTIINTFDILPNKDQYHYMPFLTYVKI